MRKRLSTHVVYNEQWEPENSGELADADTSLKSNVGERSGVVFSASGSTASDSTVRASAAAITKSSLDGPASTFGTKALVSGTRVGIPDLVKMPGLAKIEVLLAMQGDTLAEHSRTLSVVVAQQQAASEQLAAILAQMPSVYTTATCSTASTNDGACTSPTLPGEERGTRANGDCDCGDTKANDLSQPSLTTKGSLASRFNLRHSSTSCNVSIRDSARSTEANSKVRAVRSYSTLYLRDSF